MPGAADQRALGAVEKPPEHAGFEEVMWNRRTSSYLPMASNPVKVALHGPDGAVETLWADSTGQPGLYVLDNVPWLAYRVSLGDTVEARPSSEGYLEMVRVVRKSGNRTIRVILEVTGSREWTEESRELMAEMRARGCGFEGMNHKLVALTIPPGVDLRLLGEYIDQAGFGFEYADPTWEELFPEGAADPAEPAV